MKAVYIGETCRSLHERHKEHMSDYTTGSEKSHMFNHAQAEHEGQAEFRIKPLKSLRSAMIR